MPTPLTGITTPTYGPDTWDDLADMAAALELLGLVAFPSEGARDAALPNPRDGQAAYVAGPTGGVSIHTATGWRYLAWREPSAPQEPTP